MTAAAAGLIPADAAAQDGIPGREPAPLVGDRPDFTESASAVTRLQVEMGYSVEAGAATDLHTVGELLVRAPLARRVELRLGVPSWSWLRRDELSGAGGADEPAGFGDASLGLKVGLREPAPGHEGPAVALLAGSTIPTGGEVGSDGFHPEVRLAASTPLTGRLSLGANAGAGTVEEGESRHGQLSGSVSLGARLTESLSAYLEGYAFAPTGEGPDASSVVNGGLTWLVGPDLQLDLRTGAGISGPSPDVVLGTGIVWRP